MSRVLIVVTHLLGAGHLTRASALARAFMRAGHEVTVVTGGMPTRQWVVEGLAVVQLPPVRTQGFDFKTLLDEDGSMVGPERRAARQRLLLATFEAVRPDVVLTELFPFGRRTLSTEFMALLAAAHARRPRPIVVSSIRDILEPPHKPERAVEAHERVRAYYDAVLVHGDAAVVPLERSWPVDHGIRPLLRATGYVDGGARASPEQAPASDIVVSGGSSSGGIRLYRTAVAAAAIVPDRAWRILIGAGVEEPNFLAIAAAAPAHMRVERARADFRALLAGCTVSVSQLGYNTAVDLLRTKPRAVFAPFEADGLETEQRLRAERFSALGWGEMIVERELSPESLAAAVRRALAAPRRDPVPILLDGADRSVAIVEELLRQRSR
jgi:predicted glycosyltransferase